MVQSVVRRPATAATVLVLVVMGLAGAGTPVVEAAGPVLTFHDPGSPVAGPVELRGVVATGATATTSVVYLVDVSQSTKSPSGLDCNGDGAVGAPGDNVNGDSVVGDTLDCEIGAVRAVNASLASSAGRSEVSLETFAAGASVVNLRPGASPPVTTVPPGATSATGANMLDAAVVALRRDPVPGTSYDPAVSTALRVLRSASAGPKYIVLLTDGGGDVSSTTVDALADSGVRLRSFAIANDVGCRASSDLRVLSEASGDFCFVVTSPSALPPLVGSAQPLTVSAVQVVVGGRTFAAAVDLAGGWRVPLTLGAGSWTATATAFLSDGSQLVEVRTFVVRASASEPPPGGVSGPTVRASTVRVDRPSATVSALPRRVTGRVGAAAGGVLVKAPLLQNATVLLEGRTPSTRRWVTVGRGLVGPTGLFAASRKTSTSVTALRARLVAHASYAGATRTVPAPTVSRCRFTRRGSGFVVRCRTIAPAGGAARLVRHGATIDRAVVGGGVVRLVGHGARSSCTLVVRGAAGAVYRLRL